MNISKGTVVLICCALLLVLFNVCDGYRMTFKPFIRSRYSLRAQKQAELNNRNVTEVPNTNPTAAPSGSAEHAGTSTGLPFKLLKKDSSTVSPDYDYGEGENAESVTK